MKHYKIDEDDKYKRTKLYNEFIQNINFKRTEYMSVKIEVLDVDPDTAALMANDIAALHDSTKTRMQHERANEALKIVEREYKSKLSEIRIMEDSIKMINSYGVFDYESQSEVTSEQYAIAIAKNDQRAVKMLEEKLQIIGKYGSAYMSLRDNMYMQRKQLNLLNSKYDEVKVDAEQILSQKFIVSNAYPAEKKSYPIRWLIVVVSTFAALLLSVIVILLIENVRNRLSAAENIE
jgi:capsular polysaccharide biosynthesis protein